MEIKFETYIPRKVKYPKLTRIEKKSCKLTEGMIKHIQELYNSGLSMKDIWLKFYNHKVSYSTIKYWCNKIYRNRTRKQTIDTDKRKIYEKSRQKRKSKKHLRYYADCRRIYKTRRKKTMKTPINEQVEQNRWMKAEDIKKALSQKKTRKKCSKCIYYAQLKKGKPISPECQQSVLTNTETFCKQRHKREWDEQ